MYFDDHKDDERDPFAAFGEPEAENEGVVIGEFGPAARPTHARYRGP